MNGKNINLIENLSFTSELSYENAERTDYGDINGNEKVEDLLTELTTGKGWIPISNWIRTGGSVFSGTFNGSGNKISNLYIDNEEETDYSGLFGFIRNGIVTNLSLSGNIYCNSDSVGGIIASHQVMNSNNIYTMDNCNFSGKIENINTNSNTGGVVGDARTLNITNSYNEAIVIGKKNAGGIASGGGRNFINCHNKGDVKGENYVGGISANRRNIF